MPTHPIPPIYSNDPQNPPRILILGSFPSVKSRETAFFYGHPQNRFWCTVAAVLRAPIPTTVEEKTALLITHGIALWDVIAACDIRGSSDSSITNVTPTDLTPILESGTIRVVFTNDMTADRLYKRYQEPLTGIPSIALPSTSPANASWSIERLCEAWSVILG